MKKNYSLIFRILVLIADAVTIGGALSVTHIARFISGNSSPCIYKYFGIQCPSCGATRCVYNFFKGNFAEAFQFNQLFFILIILALILLVLLNLRFVFGLKFAEKPLRLAIHPATAVVFVVAFLVFGILRNVIA